MADISKAVERQIERMDPSETVRAAIRLHLRRQKGVKKGHVKLSDGSIVREGESPE